MAPRLPLPCILPPALVPAFTRLLINTVSCTATFAQVAGTVGVAVVLRRVGGRGAVVHIAADRVLIDVVVRIVRAGVTRVADPIAVRVNLIGVFTVRAIVERIDNFVRVGVRRAHYHEPTAIRLAGSGLSAQLTGSATCILDTESAVPVS